MRLLSLLFIFILKLTALEFESKERKILMVKTLLTTSNLKFNQTHTFVRQGHTFDLQNFLKSAIRFHLNCLSRHLVISKRVPSKQEKKISKKRKIMGDDEYKKWYLKEIHIHTHTLQQKRASVVEKSYESMKIFPFTFSTS